MTQHLEIEFKNLLTKEEFIRLKQFFQIKNDEFFKQENHYFDTKQFTLRNAKSALRIREINGRFELTLKQKVKDGHLEINEMIPEAAAKRMFEKKLFPHGEISKTIETLKINLTDIEYFGSLKTIRAERKYKDGLIVLDHSFYLNEEDFELEYEVKNKQTGQKVFFQLLHEIGIPLRGADNKIQRFFKQKNFTNEQ
ncbi:CYTH domain-containing protein [Bacillus aquiflavi]|uniref:CYTH domain-containing protein n=1 Tax=Bacillus aquiflavi TaxID=2672567 RepID=A0A6B3VYY9_9BACI|nr:CYTH domain-containing protein [Bacillus aquiflavi]MBA4536438.1 CYTH domain-containing protein [Bacillus aquiflavi]NEY80806.1 CYTH domain-containing protein [Bacillus aquiflavi]